MERGNLCEWNGGSKDVDVVCFGDSEQSNQGRVRISHKEVVDNKD